ncbi:ATP-binding cassette domain-containing protein [Oceanicella sp. SM1341]|uniref:ATP-binding cassette domain-containing protein n=1 Tax=Oceanicella sp. SM1341 TaxID=1548889 RepID=UPI000E4AD227|nr:ATP-binding cassette domain-containing protein [Oceanicella sp. SM1341]
METAPFPDLPGRPLMRVDHVTLHEGNVTPLRAVCLSLRAGECLSLIGPKGAGKSELLALLGRRLADSPDCRLEGSVRLDGRDLMADGPARPDQIAWVQEAAAPLEGSVHECIARGLRAAGRARNEAEVDVAVTAALRRAGLWPELTGRLQSFGADLTFGQQRRLALAMALACRPEILVMGEPFVSDPAEADAMLGVLEGLRGRLTIVFQSRDLPRARRLADRTAYMQAGKLLEIGETRQVFDAPRSPACGAFIARAWG